MSVADLEQRLASFGGARALLERHPDVTWEALAARAHAVLIEVLTSVQEHASSEGWLDRFSRDAMARALHECLPEGWTASAEMDPPTAQAFADWVATMGTVGEEHRALARNRVQRLTALDVPIGWKPVGADDPFLVAPRSDAPL